MPPHGIPPQRLPATNPNMPDWYDPRFFANEKNAYKHDRNVLTFIMRNDMSLRQIILKGGGKLLCELWKDEVAEFRRNIQQVRSEYEALILDF